MKQLCIITFMLLSNLLLAQYNNASLNGPWFLHKEPMVGLEDSTDFLVFDGAGKIVDGSMHGVVLGNYSVSTMGVLSGNLTVDGNTLVIGGLFTSPTKINMGEYRLTKVDNPGALTDTLKGILSTMDYGSKTVMFVLNSEGKIISSTGLVGPVSGRVYVQNNVFVGHIRSGETANWNEFGFYGDYSNDSLIGGNTVDGPRGPGRSGNALLIRTGNVTTVGLTSKIQNTITIKVYPNPASNEINIENTINEDMDVAIYNITGKLVMSQTIHAVKQPINISDLPSGIYMIEFESKTRSSMQKLIIEK